MLVYSIALFALAAVFGLYLISRVLKGALPPWLPVIVHGVFAASGLLLLLYSAFLSGMPASGIVTVAAVLLVIAALGGFLLFSFQLRKQVPPKAVAVIHALVAVLGFLTLCYGVFGAGA